MRNDMLEIDMPTYEVEYKEESYSYLPGPGRERLKDILYNASNDYCMYCYKRIKVDGNMYGHLEHAMEKTISTKKLSNCIPNIGIACPTCNEKYKRIGEKLRKPDKKDIEEFENSASCTEKYCKTPCKEYLEFRKKYLKRKESRFIMQPLGVNSRDIGAYTNRELKLQYDVLETKFIPSKKEKYTKEEKEFIMHHIDMFHLNTAEHKSSQLINFLKDTIEHEGNYANVEYNNRIVELFVEQILKGKNAGDILKICEKIYTYATLKFNVCNEITDNHEKNINYRRRI